MKGQRHSLWARFRRILLALARGLGVLLLCAVVLVGTALLTVGLFPHLITAPVTSQLSGLFRGRLVIENIGALGPRGVSGLEVVLLDPSGRPIGHAWGVRGRLSWWGLGREILGSGGTTVIDIEHLEVDVLHLDLGQDESGTLLLERALESPRPSKNEAAPVVFELGRGQVREAWIYSSDGSVRFDASLRSTEASVGWHESTLELRKVRSQTLVRIPELPLRDLDISGDARLEFAESQGKKDAGGDPLFGLMGTITARLESHGSTLDLSYRGDSKRFDATTHASLGPVLAREVGVALTTPAVIDARANGTSTDVQLVLDVRQGTSRSRAEMRIRDAGATHVTGTIELRQVSPSLVSVEGVSPLDADLSFEATRRASGASEMDRWTATATGTVGPVAVEAVSLPPLAIEARYSERHARVEVRSRKADESRVLLDAWFEQDASLRRVRLRGDIDAQRISEALGERVRGRGRVRFELEKGSSPSTIEASIAGRIHDLEVGPDVAVAEVEFEGSVGGRFDEPVFDVNLEGERGVFAGRRVESLSASLRGSTKRSAIEATITSGALEGRVFARVSLVDGSVVVDDMRVQLEGKEDRLSLVVGKIVVKNSQVVFSSLRLDGAGYSDLSGTVGSAGFSLRGSVRDFSLGRLENLLETKFPVSGVADMDIDFTLLDRMAKGRVRAILSGFEIHREFARAEIAPAEIHLDVVGTGSELGAWVSLDFAPQEKGREEHIHVEFTMDAPERRALSDPKALFAFLKQLDGRFDVDLAPLSNWISEVENGSGQATGHLAFTRPTPSSEPHVTLSLHLTETGGTLRPASTKEEAGTPGEVSTEKPPLVVDIEDLGIDLYVESEPSRSQTDALVHLKRRGQDLLLVELSVERTLFQLQEAVEKGLWTTIPGELEAMAPGVDLESLPFGLDSAGLGGTVSATLEMTGTLGSPRGKLHLDVDELGPSGSNWSDPNLAGKLDADYDGRKLSWSAALSGQQGIVVEGHGELVAPWAALGPPEPERLEAELVLRRLPLEMVPKLDQLQVRGPVDLSLTVVGWGTERERVTLDAELTDVVVQEVPLENASLKAELRQSTVSGQLHLGNDEYFLHAEGRTQIARSGMWGIDIGAEQQGKLRARDFPLTILNPLMGRSVAGLDGIVDADVRAWKGEKSPLIEGSVELHDGRVQIPTLGQRLRDIHARASLSEDGTLRIEDASFQGPSGRGTFDVDAKLVGLWPKSGTIALEVSRDERLPVVLAGLGTGEVAGALTTDFELDEDERILTTKTRVKQFHLWLPQLPTQKAQSLGPADAIRVGTRLETDHLVEIPLQPVDDGEQDEEPFTVRAHFDLGDEFWLSQSTVRRVQVAGSVTIEVGREVVTSGTLRLPRGQFELNGRTFEVHHGTISLQPEEPDNPIIMVEAHWRSPDGILVIAKFTGPAKSGEMSLSSDPPLRNDQIVSLLLFGDPSGMGQATGGDNTAGQAAVVGGAVATKGINNALRRYEGIDLSTRVRGEGDNVRPELVVQLTNSLSAELGYNLEEPSPGKSPDRTLLTFEFRLMGGSSLSLTAGDRGTTLFDWVWRYRY